MKAMLISEIFPPKHGGSGRWFWEVYSRLPRDEYILAVGCHPGFEKFDQSQDLNIERIDLSSTDWGVRSIVGLKFYYNTFMQLRKLIKTHKIDQLHCGRCLPEGVMALLLNKIYGFPFKSFIHGEDVETAAQSRELSWIIRRVFSNADTLICNSQNTANLILNKWHTPAEKVIVLNPGVDADRFIPAERDQSIRDKLNWQDRPVILTVGRLQERKGQDILIQALPQIKKHIPDILYAVVGGGEEKPKLENLVKKLSLEVNVQFFDEISDEDMVRCYQQCDLFALPNRTVGNDIEGFGMVLVEAQACAKPVIAGNSGGTAETMLIGETGFIVDCTHPKPLADKIIELLASPDKLVTMGKAARAHVSAALDWSTLARKAESIFLDSKYLASK